MSRELLISDSRFRFLLAFTALAAVGYLGFSVWAGWDGVVAALVRIGVPVTLVALLGSLLNYGARFLRWHGYLLALHHQVPKRWSLRVYIAGFALTATPGKAGEALRSVLLKPGVPYSDSLAALLSERFSDICAVLILAAVGLATYPDFYPVAVVFVVACLGFITALLPAPQRWVRALLQRWPHRLAGLLLKILSIFEKSRLANPPPMMAAGLVLGLFAWWAEGFAFFLLLEQVDAQIPWHLAVSIYCLSMLAGAISFMPGGLGGAEVAMTALLTLAGVELETAVAVTLLIRMATLWFAVLLGVVTLLPLLKHKA